MLEGSSSRLLEEKRIISKILHQATAIILAVNVYRTYGLMF